MDSGCARVAAMMIVTSEVVKDGRQRRPDSRQGRHKVDLSSFYGRGLYRDHPRLASFKLVRVR